ncbi:hypothetical protein AAFF_G00130430 [Aldrovandia affinis]|uniref:Uncharacterized protein n=1 Tax=Aldrovandia affinis TaxID=143900 RepID=A0AAD7RRB1_9TELE|nr:hypothetical protein AAFF_G00130430 [Aldrovandia affinis]
MWHGGAGFRKRVPARQFPAPAAIAPQSRKRVGTPPPFAHPGPRLREECTGRLTSRLCWEGKDSVHTCVPGTAFARRFPRPCLRRGARARAHRRGEGLLAGGDPTGPATTLTPELHS